jgi:predicted Zn-dependent protease
MAQHGRVFSGATGDAAERIDLLTIATHEIGHALGLDLQATSDFPISIALRLSRWSRRSRSPAFRSS